MQFKALMMAVLAAGSATAHMNMKSPPPLMYKGNPNTSPGDADYSLTSPITGAQYPCKGYLSKLGTPEGASVATYAPGQSSTIELEGSASHGGGSCQISLSYDQGKTFTVIQSIIGNCPTSAGGSFPFTIPSDAQTGPAVLSWSWVNKIGNREFYQNCASITIGGSSKRTAISARSSVAYADRPQIFTANLGGNDQYCTKEGVDTVYPEPGPDVVDTATSPGPAIMCATGANAPEGSTSGSGSSSGSSVSSAGSDSSSSSSESSSDLASAVTPSGGVFLTTGGTIVSTSSESSEPPASSAAPSDSSSSSSAPAASSDSSTPVLSPTSASSAPVQSGSSNSSGAMTGPCTDEGAWNCIGGSSFQRCASEQWSAVQPMAAGTQCTPGISDTLSQVKRRRDRVLRHF
ncbi:hypothetical protein F5Y16DRAFT_108042 [Xylariaceae sp. FL0255]|nr:hypothetical protein F5Y16DRAFT_108042 [Xylariaceae sp. FL0255]